MHPAKWQIELETLRRLVAKRAPLARFSGTTPSRLRAAEYRFAVRSGPSVYVQSPTTPTGKPRVGRSVWRYRRRRDENWKHSDSIHTVVDYILNCSELP